MPQLIAQQFKKLLTIAFACCMFTVCMAQKADTIKTSSGLKYIITTKGSGEALKPGWLAVCHYILKLTDGTKIDDSRERDVPLATPFLPGKVVKGFYEALSLLHVGDRGVFILPYNLGYGEYGKGAIPPKATLVFDIELLDTKAKSVQMVLDSVLFTKPVTESSIPQTELTIKTFKTLKKGKFKDIYVSENDLNAIGYELFKKFPKDALEFFKLNAEQFPDSFNVYDSLGECYMVLEDGKNALKNYEKSLKINPDNKNAREMILKINSLAPSGR